MKGIVKSIKPGSILRCVLDRVTAGQHSSIYNRMWIKTMMKRRNALGFAANQLNMNHYAFLAKISGKWQFFANPMIVRASKETAKSIEGCLSLPNVEYEIVRHEEIELDWEDKNGNGQSQIYKGLDAVVIQHEIDHLNGMLICDKGEKHG